MGNKLKQFSVLNNGPISFAVLGKLARETRSSGVVN